MATNQFEVFGVDVRDYGKLWLAAWREFLFGDDSPVRAVLDSVVRLQKVDGTEQCYQAGRVIESAAELQALALPDELVLSRELTLPPIAEADLDTALSLEVNACSPFAYDDTAAGWVIHRSPDNGLLTVALVVVSRAAVMRFLAEKHGINDPEGSEVWAPCGERWVSVRGFGEGVRHRDYRNRLLRTSGLIGGSLFLMLVLAWASAFLASAHLSRLEGLQVDVRNAARNAMELRDELTSVNETVNELNKLSRQLTSPHGEIARLTTLLPDSAYITQYTQEGRKIRLRGRGTDAAALQQSLTEQEAFSSVTSPQAISRVGNSGVEQFFLDIELDAAQ